jgi:hypothetical protein
MIRIMGKQNKNWQNRPQAGQSQNNQQNEKAAIIEQKPVNAPLSDVVNSAPTVAYASEAELASLMTLLGRLEESAQKFGDNAVEITGIVVADIRSRIVTVGTLSEADATEIKRLETEIEAIEAKAGCASPFEPVSLAAYTALEEGTDEMSAKWRDNQALIAEFGGEETKQMTAIDYKDAVDTLAPQQILAFVWATANLEGTPSVFVDIETSFNELLEGEEEPQPEAQPQIAAV